MARHVTERARETFLQDLFASPKTGLSDNLAASPSVITYAMITNLRVVGAISKLVRILPVEVADVARLEVGIGQKVVHRFYVIFVRLRIVFVVHDERPRLVRLGAEAHARVLRQDGVISDQTGRGFVGETVEENRQQPYDEESRVHSIEFFIF